MMCFFIAVWRIYRRISLQIHCIFTDIDQSIYICLTHLSCLMFFLGCIGRKKFLVIILLKVVFWFFLCGEMRWRILGPRTLRVLHGTDKVLHCRSVQSLSFLHQRLVLLSCIPTEKLYKTLGPQVGQVVRLEYDKVEKVRRTRDQDWLAIA